MAGNPRHGRPYRRLVDWLRSQRLPCWLFGHPVGYDLDARHPLTVSRPKNTSGLVILPRRWVVEG